jgi:transcription elongation factor GreA
LRCGGAAVQQCRGAAVRGAAVLPCCSATGLGRAKGCATITTDRAARPVATTDMKDQLLKRLQDEIAALDRELKVELPREIQRARELGDLRENAEYHAAKERQTYVQARISMLQTRVAALQMINLDKLPRDRAAFGSTLHLREDSETRIFQLVMPEDADVEKGLISTSSPIGRALVGKEAGDEVVVVTPNGKRSFEILKLLTVHDSV